MNLLNKIIPVIVFVSGLTAFASVDCTVKAYPASELLNVGYVFAPWVHSETKKELETAQECVDLAKEKLAEKWSMSGDDFKVRKVTYEITDGEFQISGKITPKTR